MKPLLLILAALVTGGCTTSPFIGAWYESPTPDTNQGLIHLSADGTFASGRQSIPGQTVQWDSAGTWKSQSPTAISLTPQDGQPHAANLVGGNQLVIVSPDEGKTFTYGRTLGK